MTDKPRIARRTIAERTAASVLRQLGMDQLRVDPIAIATAKDIVVQAKPETTEGVSGMLLKAGDNFGIIYATNIPSLGFQRFSVAHELGHYFLEGHCDALLGDGFHVSRAGFVTGDPFEQEADFFAAALLMPDRPFRRAMDDHEPGLACVESLRKDCGTSLTATAIRYSSLTRDGVAAIVSRGSSVEYCFISDGMKQAKGLIFLRKGSPVPTASATYAFNMREESVRTGKTEYGSGQLSDWMGSDARYAIKEEVVGLGQCGRTLTILTCERLSARPEQEPDEDDEEALIDSWTARFGR